jgi:uncharacterized protein YciI
VFGDHWDGNRESSTVWGWNTKEGEVSEWVYFLHPPRENFAATMTDDERAVWQRHFEWLGELLREGRLVLAGPTGGAINTGIAIFEAADEDSARRTVSQDPVTQAGFARGELRPFLAGLAARSRRMTSVPSKVG